MKITISQVVEYKGHNVKQSGAVTLTLGAAYDEITDSIKLLQLINEDVSLKAKMPNQKPVFVGTFKINGINFAKDGKSTIKLTSISEAVDTDNLSGIVTTGQFRVQYEGDIEAPEEEEEEEENE